MRASRKLRIEKSLKFAQFPERVSSYFLEIFLANASPPTPHAMRKDVAGSGTACPGGSFRCSHPGGTACPSLPFSNPGGTSCLGAGASLPLSNPVRLACARDAPPMTRKQAVAVTAISGLIRNTILLSVKVLNLIFSYMY